MRFMQYDLKVDSGIRSRVIRVPANTDSKNRIVLGSRLEEFLQIKRSPTKEHHEDIPHVRIFWDITDILVSGIQHNDLIFVLRPSPCDSGQSTKTLISPGVIILKTDATQIKSHSYRVRDGKFHGQSSLVGYSPWCRKESDTTEQLHFTSLHYIND